MNYPVFQV